MIKNSAIRTILGKQLGIDNIVLTPIKKGANNRVFKINNKQPYVIKFYFQYKGDKRDRLNTEFRSMKFLWKYGIRCIPEPITMDTQYGFAIYKYIDGMPILSSGVTENHINQMVQFILSLESLQVHQDAACLPNASEACFSFEELILNIQSRLGRLKKTTFSVSEEYKQLFIFLDEYFQPTFEKILNRDPSYHFEISKEQKILSPSDFGFHNSVCQSDGKIYFLDFEYFGWDDPAKTLCDFILHPAMEIPLSLKKLFVREVVNRLWKDTSLEKRTEMAYPLYGLKWCLILLNEFLPDQLLRRQFALQEQLNMAELQRKQLTKAEQMLDRVLREYEQFSHLYL